MPNHDSQSNTAQIRRLLNVAFDDSSFDAFCQDYFYQVYNSNFGRGMGKNEKITKLLDHCHRTPNGFGKLLDALTREYKANPERHELGPLIEVVDIFIQSFVSSQQKRLFICYKRHADPDQQLAIYLRDILTTQRYTVFIDQSMRTGEAWLEQIDQEIKGSDFLIVLLSEASADSEMVRAEIKRAYDYRELQGRPQTLPVRIAYEGLLPYAVAAFVDPLQYVVWRSDADNERIVREILTAMTGQLLPNSTPTSRPQIISEDGNAAPDDNTLQSPLPEFDPRLLKELIMPIGPIKLRDKFYVEREADAQLKEQIIKWGTTITIRAPRQAGKTSLLMRGIHHAKQNGAKVVLLDLQSFGSDRLSSPEVFLREIADTICHQLRLETDKVEKLWQGTLGAQQKLTYFLEDQVLPEFETPIILAIDEADSLLSTSFYKDFFGLVRAWCSQQVFNPEQWEKLNIILVISTEPYLLINDINQSPFNVGTTLELDDFSSIQVRSLNHKHGSPLIESKLPQFMELLGGQPYLTRKALYVLVKQAVTWNDLIKKASTDQGPFGDHLKRHHWGLHNQPELKAALSQIVRSNQCSDETSVQRLLRAGLIKGSGSHYICRCGLYRLYFQDKLR